MNSFFIWFQFPDFTTVSVWRKSANKSFIRFYVGCFSPASIVIVIYAIAIEEYF